MAYAIHQMRREFHHGSYNTHGHKLRFPAFEKAQFVTECGIAVHFPYRLILRYFPLPQTGFFP